MGRLAIGSSWARLSFWVWPEHLVEFNGIYGEKLVPLLAQHQLVEQKGCPSPAVEGVCSHFFAVGAPEEVAVRGNELQRDPQWMGWLKTLGEDFGSAGEGHTLEWRWGIYQAEAGAGTTTALGLGNRHGRWQCFGLREGLPSVDITALFRDRQGCLWFGTSRGVCCYDGAKFTTLGVSDGLIDKKVLSILEGPRGAPVVWHLGRRELL